MMENKRTRGNFNVMCRLVGLVKPLAPVMVCAVLLGVVGFLCAIFIPVLGVYALLDTLLPAAPVALGTICMLLPVLAGPDAMWFAMPLTELAVAAGAVWGMVRLTRSLSVSSAPCQRRTPRP